MFPTNFFLLFFLSLIQALRMNVWRKLTRSLLSWSLHSGWGREIISKYINKKMIRYRKVLRELKQVTEYCQADCYCGAGWELTFKVRSESPRTIQEQGFPGRRTKLWMSLLGSRNRKKPAWPGPGGSGAKPDSHDFSCTATPRVLLYCLRPGLLYNAPSLFLT